jgi:Ca2+-binding RTX toxin-like protein
MLLVEYSFSNGELIVSFDQSRDVYFSSDVVESEDYFVAKDISDDSYIVDGRPNGDFGENGLLTADIDSMWVVGSGYADTIDLDDVDTAHGYGDSLYTLVTGDPFLATGANDSIIGSPLSDDLYGAGGDDTIRGGDKKDYIVGGSGADTIYGDDGNDTIYTGKDFMPSAADSSDDKAYGGKGDDKIAGSYYSMTTGGGDDSMYGGPDYDRIIGTEGSCYLKGDAGNDWLESRSGSGSTSSLYGDGGEDFLEASDNGDKLYGGAEADEIFGGDGSDYFKGDAGDDTIYMNSSVGGNDTIYGDAGNDSIGAHSPGAAMVWGGADNDFVDINDGAILGGSDYAHGGDGTDTIDYDEERDTAVYFEVTVGEERSSGESMEKRKARAFERWLMMFEGRP